MFVLNIWDGSAVKLIFSSQLEMRKTIEDLWPCCSTHQDWKTTTQRVWPTSFVIHNLSVNSLVAWGFLGYRAWISNALFKPFSVLPQVTVSWEHLARRLALADFYHSASSSKDAYILSWHFTPSSFSAYILRSEPQSLVCGAQPFDGSVFLCSTSTLLDSFGKFTGSQHNESTRCMLETYINAICF